MSGQIRTIEEARAWFDRHGVPLSEWAKARGFKPSVVASILSGKCRGKRGEAHLVAIALGLKNSPPPSEPSPMDFRTGEFEQIQLVHKA